RIVFRVALTVGVARILFLDVRRVGQDQAAELLRGRRAENTAPEAVLDEPGQVAAVIQVRVGEDHRVDGARGHRERLPVAGPKLLQALKQAAVHQNPAAGDVEEVLGAGDGAGGAQKGQR